MKKLLTTVSNCLSKQFAQFSLKPAVLPYTNSVSNQTKSVGFDTNCAIRVIEK